MARFVYNSPPIPAPDEDGQVFEATGVGTAAWTRILDKLEAIGVDYIDMVPGLANPAHKEGRIFYDDTNKTLAVYNNESDVTLQLGQEIYIRVKNDKAFQIDNGTLVYIDGAINGIATIELARSDSPLTTGVIAMATHDIGIGEMGFVTVLGSVGSLDTDGLGVGTVLYLSETIEGEWQDFAPTAPNFPIQIGTVIRESLTEGQILVIIGPTDVAQTMVIQDLEINEDLRVDKKFTLNPSPLTDITAVGGITITNATMRIQGDGGPVVITAVPQIAAGTDGQLAFIQGQNDTNTITIHDGDGLMLHSGSILIIGEHDYIIMQYDTGASQWEEVSTNFKSFDTGWSWASPAGSSGTFYVGGFYILPSANYTPAGGTSLGLANVAYGAHVLIVLGADSTDMVVRITGTSITEQGVRTPSDTEDLDTSGGVTDDYFETITKWIGQVSVSLLSGTGVVINHGLCKYWDNQNSNFRITGIEVTGRAGANDSAPNFELLRHEPRGWTYSTGGAIPPPPLADMQIDYGTEFQLANNQPFAWKKIGLSVEIAGNVDEGVIWRLVTTANKAVEVANLTLSIRPS